MQHDDARPLAQRVDDPAVRVRVVADVVERDVGGGRALARLGDDDVDPLAQRRQEQRRVVGDPRPRRRQRRVVGDPHHDRRRVDAGVPGDALGDGLAGAAPRLRLVDVRAEVRAGAGERGGVGRDDDARSRGRARPRAGRRRRSSSAPAWPRGTPRTGPSRSPRRRARSRRRGSARRDRRAARRRRGRRTRPGRSDPTARRSSRSRSGPSPAITIRSAGSAFAASISRSMRFARSSRLTESTKPSGSRACGRRAPAAGAAGPRPRSR